MGIILETCEFSSHARPSPLCKRLSTSHFSQQSLLPLSPSPSKTTSRPPRNGALSVMPSAVPPTSFLLGSRVRNASSASAAVARPRRSVRGAAAAFFPRSRPSFGRRPLHGLLREEQVPRRERRLPGED